MTEPTTEATTEPSDDQLAQLPAEKLAQLLRDKRKDEAKARTRAGEAEAERDRLKGVVTAWSREKLHGIATGNGVLASALSDLDDRLDVSGLLTDAGTLDETKATEAITALRADRPHYFEQPKPAKSSGISTTGGSGENTPTGPTWSDVIRG